MLELLLVAGIVALDQFVKHLCDLYLMPLGTSIPVIEDVLHLTSVHNTGAAFGIFSNATWLLALLSAIAAAMMVFILARYRKKLHIFTRICIALILGGAIGNLIDRAFLGYVRDMFELRFVNFAVFNIADCGVTVGCLLLAIDVLFGPGRKYFGGKQKPADVDGEKEAPPGVEPQEGMGAMPAPEGEAPAPGPGEPS